MVDVCTKMLNGELWSCGAVADTYAGMLTEEL